jgi:hypothetical protein
MNKVKERGRTKAPETSNLASDTRAAEPVRPAEQEIAEQEIDAGFMLAFLKGSGLTRAKLAWPLRDPTQRFNHLYLAASQLCAEGHALMWEAFGAATSISNAAAQAESIKTVAAHLLPVMVEDGLRAAADPKAGSEGHACFRKTQSEIVAVLLGEAPATNSPVENCQETSHNKLMLDRPNIGDAALEQRQSEFVRLAKEIGLATAGKLLVEAASPDERAHIASMAACVREVTSPEPPPAPVAPKISEADLAAFRKHAKSHPWKPDCGVAPSAHIEATFAKWLNRGLMLKHIRAAQSNLAGAYSTEVSRAPSKRVEGLYVAPHNLPAGTPRPASKKLAAEMTDGELAETRKKNKTYKSASRQRQQSLHM